MCDSTDIFEKGWETLDHVVTRLIRCFYGLLFEILAKAVLKGDKILKQAKANYLFPLMLNLKFENNSA
jgi:hypothetical protein